MYTKRQMAVLYVAATLTVAFAGAATWIEIKPPAPPLEKYGQLPAFTLTNQDGDRVTLDDLRGTVWLADFVYTTCPGPCPMISAHMGRLSRMLPAEARIVSFSTDPDRDTPAVLRAYAKRFGAGGSWTFLTGPKDEMYSLIQHGFMLPIMAPAGSQIVHSTRIMLVDKSGAVRGLYDGTTSGSDAQILADVRRLLAE